MKITCIEGFYNTISKTHLSIKNFFWKTNKNIWFANNIVILQCLQCCQLKFVPCQIQLNYNSLMMNFIILMVPGIKNQYLLKNIANTDVMATLSAIAACIRTCCEMHRRFVSFNEYVHLVLIITCNTNFKILISRQLWSVANG